MSNLRTLRNILLVVIGLNTLVVLAMLQPGGGAEALIGGLGVVMTLSGAYFILREVLWQA